MLSSGRSGLLTHSDLLQFGEESSGRFGTPRARGEFERSGFKARSKGKDVLEFAFLPASVPLGKARLADSPPYRPGIPQRRSC